MRELRRIKDLLAKPMILSQGRSHAAGHSTDRLRRSPGAGTSGTPPIPTGRVASWVTAPQAGPQDEAHDEEVDQVAPER